MIMRAQSKGQREETLEVLQHFVPLDQKVEAEKHKARLAQFVTKYKLDFNTSEEFKKYCGGLFSAA